MTTWTWKPPRYNSAAPVPTSPRAPAASHRRRSSISVTTWRCAGDETPELFVGRAARPIVTSKALQNAIWKRCDQVGMWRVSPMVLRHTFAIKLLRRGASLGQLKDALGVRDTTNIGVYKKFV